MSLGSRTKDPADSRNYAIDWSAWLTSQNNDTISGTPAWAGGGLTVVSSSNTTTTATAKLSGGTAGQTYTVANTIVTAAGQTIKKSFLLSVETQ